MTKEPAPKPWDRRPWPESGDDRSEIYKQVGAALSAWEMLEFELADLFAIIVCKDGYRTPARRAFMAIRTFEARCEMLKASSLAFFDYKTDEKSKKLQTKFKRLISLASSFGPRRNDIAHGFVFGYPKKGAKQEDPRVSYLLYPSFASFKERDINNLATYAMNVTISSISLWNF